MTTASRNRDAVAEQTSAILQEGAILFSALQQQAGRLELRSIALGQLAAAVDEGLQPVGIDALEYAAGLGRETDAHDGADVALGGLAHHALLHGPHRLQALAEQQPVLDVLVGKVAVAVGAKCSFSPGQMYLGPSSGYS